MLRKLIVVGVIILLGIDAAAAQACDDAIKTRQTLMKRSGEMAKLGASINRGDTPFDLAKTQEIFAVFAEDASKTPNLFPECSKSGDHTNAAPAIWEKIDEFKAMATKFAADVKAAEESTKDAETFRAGFLAISKDCTNCHGKFRTRNN